MARVFLENIVKRYEGADKNTINETTLEIHDKEFLILVGPSGCGKSTTIRMIAGLEDITSGKILIDDKVVNDLEPKDRDIAMVFQNYALYPHMNVYENMSFGLRLKKMDKKVIDEKVKDAAEILSISDLLDRKPKEMSGGQRQRVALGRAIVRNPKVFLMDEPLSNLDAKLRVQMRAEIIKLHKKLQTTMIYVTHDQVEAMTMGDRIAVFDNGYIQQCDKPQIMYDYPENKFVATFIGSPQMNMLDVVVKDEDTVNFNGKLLKFNKTFEEGGLANYKESKVCFGIRPENIYVKSICKDTTPTEDNTIKVKVDVMELMGSEMYINCYFVDQKIVIKSPPIYDIKMGDEIEVVFNMNKILFFDNNTEKRIK